jgi:hypothetical protein
MRPPIETQEALTSMSPMKALKRCGIVPPVSRAGELGVGDYQQQVFSTRFDSKLILTLDIDIL